jgi:maltooligosyltrehalose trehalohydrolase
MGPDGNYLGVYHGSYFSARHKTPWGDGLNFEEPAVREFFAENAPYWRREFHIDGFRLDATHAMEDSSERHILAEISDRVHASGAFLVAEDERNEPEVLRPVEAGGLGFNGVWSDDFHHVVRVMLTGQREGYYVNFQGSSDELAETLEHGWLFRGERKREDGEQRGGESIDFPPEQFVYCISNHDQVGNRAFGERLGHLIEPAAYRAASALICLVPYTPMLFMGQEWSASSPFQFFTDHNAELGKLVTQGRRKEFRHFAAFRDPEVLQTIPDPQAESTFANSKLRWDEIVDTPRAQMLELHREFLRVRKTHPAFRDRSRENWRVAQVADRIVAILFGRRSTTPCLLLIDLIGGHAAPDVGKAAAQLSGDSGGAWELFLSSDDARFGGSGASPFTAPTTALYERR